MLLLCLLLLPVGADPAALLRSGKARRALEEARRRAEHAEDPYELQVWTYDAGLAAAALKDPAAPDWLRRAAAGPDARVAVSALYALGNTLARAGDREGALRAWRACLRRDPSHDDARFNYEWLLRRPPGGGGKGPRPEQRPPPPAPLPRPRVNRPQALKRMLLGPPPPPRPAEGGPDW